MSDPSKFRRRRLLLISYYFPPAGGQGVQRALQFARYLPAHGWQPTVLTVRPEDAAYPDMDAALLRQVPPALRVERTGAWDPYALYARLQGKTKAEAVSVSFAGEGAPNAKQRLARWVRANLFLPDARVGWVPFATRRGLKLLRTHVPDAHAPGARAFDAVLTTGPPHSSHLIGLLLSRCTGGRRTGVPWVADFRDPWTAIDYAHQLPSTALARKLDATLERHVLRRADAVTTVTRTWRAALARHAGPRCRLIRNGFDPADFAAEAPPLAEGFTIAHVGNMNAARTPVALWQALRGLGAHRWASGVHVRLVGAVDPAARAAARRAGVGGLVQVGGYRPHDEAVRIMQSSTLLLLVVDHVPGQAGRVPGKLYEYAASGRPVLGLGPPEGEAAALLRETGAGRMFAHDDARGVGRYVQKHYGAWAKGRPRAGARPEAAAAYSRRTQAAALAEVLDDVRRS